MNFRSILLALPFVVACGGPSEFAVVGTARSPGTDGTVTVDEAEGGNRLVTVALTNVVPPDRLAQGLTKYSVWYIGTNAQPVNAGDLAFDPEARTGRLTFTTPLTTFELRVTAERPNASAPSEHIVVQRRVAPE